MPDWQELQDDQTRRRWAEFLVGSDARSALYQLDALVRLEDELGPLLASRAAELEQEAEALAAQLSEEQFEDEYQEVHADLLVQDGVHRADEVRARFPELVRAGLFVSAYSRFELFMETVCERMQGALGKAGSLAEIRESGPKRYKGFTKKTLELPFPDQTPAWREICFMATIRNYLAHGAGRLDLSVQAAKKLVRLARQRREWVAVESLEAPRRGLARVSLLAGSTRVAGCWIADFTTELLTRWQMRPPPVPSDIDPQILEARLQP